MRPPAPPRSLICATRPPATPSTICQRTKSTAPFRKYPDFMERSMKRPNGSPPLYLASSATEKTLVASSEQRLQSVLATLDGCRSILVDRGDVDTAHCLSVAILQLRLKLNQISDTELKALCDAMVPEDEPAERP